MTPEDLEARVRELRTIYVANKLPVMTLTLHLYSLYVEIVRHIAEGEADDPQRLSRTLLDAIAHHFPDRPWERLDRE